MPCERHFNFIARWVRTNFQSTLKLNCSSKFISADMVRNFDLFQCRIFTRKKDSEPTCCSHKLFWLIFLPLFRASFALCISEPVMEVFYFEKDITFGNMSRLLGVDWTVVWSGRFFRIFCEFCLAFLDSGLLIKNYVKNWKISNLAQPPRHTHCIRREI